MHRPILRSICSFSCFLLFCLMASRSSAQTANDSLFPVRALCTNAPSPKGVDSFVNFINKGMAAHRQNLLVLQIEYNYQFKSHPELADSGALSTADIKKIVRACQANHIKIVPQINFLGHQSWESRVGILLKKYPQFDETPWIKIPPQGSYVWPNADSLYCKSYCPLAPGLHKVLFDLMDELTEVFETDAFHGGMDEVFYIGMDKCPRCGGKDRSVLFAGEVKALHDHLAEKNKKLYIWGDRLIDGRSTGIGEWEASYNDTWRAIDMIPKDVVIFDWHYERADKTPVYFAMKGLPVITCPWRTPESARQQVRDMVDFRAESTPEMKERLLGICETTWSSTARFISGFLSAPSVTEEKTPANTYRAIVAETDKLK